MGYPYLGDLLTGVINQLLSGMILQVPPLTAKKKHVQGTDSPQGALGSACASARVRLARLVAP